MGNTIPVAEDVVEFIKRGTESEQIALENLKTIAPAIKKQMTEQEKRRIEIDKMANDLFAVRCWVDDHSDLSYKSDRYHRIVECLISKGYRNEEEVRKETLMDIMSYLYELSRDDMTDKEAACFDYIERMFCKKFGVEKVESNSNSEPEVREETETMCRLVNSDSVIGNYIIESIEKNIFEIQKQDILSFDKALSEKLKPEGYYTIVDTNDLTNFEYDYSFLFDSVSQSSFKLNESNKDSLLVTLKRYFRYGMLKIVIDAIKTTFQETIKQYTDEVK